MSWTLRIGRLARTIALGLAVLALVACSMQMNLLGGREKCWPESEPRVASLWRGTLRIDASGAWLDTPEGEVIPLIPGTLGTRIGDGGTGELVRGSDVVARAGADLTLFGGAGSDGALIVCGVEEIHGPS